MKKILFIIVAAIGLAACGIGNTNTTYSRSEIGAQGNVQYGTIMSMQVVQVAGKEGIGTLGGAIAGGAAGSMIGGNTAVNIIGGVGGAILGGVVGGAAENAITKDTAMEFIVRKDNGQTVVVVQSNELGLRPGDRVMLMNVDGTTRIRGRAY